MGMFQKVGVGHLSQENSVSPEAEDNTLKLASGPCVCVRVCLSVALRLCPCVCVCREGQELVAQDWDQGGLGSLRRHRTRWCAGRSPPG